uniref:Putative membrane glycoprotein lig-1 n=1 Tax=Xenopsylla cheopis TaxID=163159 RepID=A0A6M2DX80_XENCH
MIMSFITLILISILFGFNSSVYGYCDVEECDCFIDDAKFVVDCSNKNMSELPKNIPKDTQKLILSNNNFEDVPDLNSLEDLEELNLSGNKIRKISAGVLMNLLKLEKVILSKNNLTKLSDIFADELFYSQSANNLIELDLSNNAITLNNDSVNDFVHTLRVLNLSNCKISSLTNPNFLKHMPMLEVLDISYNPLSAINNLQSDSLIQLDASHCQLGFLNESTFQLTNLTKLNLSWNPRIYFSRHRPIVKSLKELDISYCNINRLKLQDFPNLKKLIARGNMINELSKESFEKNRLLEYINLSRNAIFNVHEETFKHLLKLKIVDLSWNIISNLDQKTFSSNKWLTNINLSRNHFSRLNPLFSESVTTLDMSWCEIQHISKDAFIGLSELTELNLSHNLISDIPDQLDASKLKKLDLTFCRLKSLRNETLQSMPFLKILLLGGNRLTTPFDVSYFSGNDRLEEIDLSDNPWRCECMSDSFKNLFNYLRSKVENIRSLKCETPSVVSGKTWSGACSQVWNPIIPPVSKSDKVWMFLMISLLSFLGTMCVVLSVRRALKAKAEATRIEEERAAEESRELERRQRLLRREAQCNAPDPRDLVSPPCYEEALLMPRLDGSFASLGHLPSGSRDNLQNKIAKNRAKSEANVSKSSPRVVNITPLIIPAPQENTTQSAVELRTEPNNEEQSDSSTSLMNSQEIGTTSTSTSNNIGNVASTIPNSPPPKYSKHNPISVVAEVTVETNVSEDVDDPAKTTLESNDPIEINASADDETENSSAVGRIPRESDL